MATTLGQLVKHSEPPKRKIRRDVNLPDESAGRPIGRLAPGEPTRDPKKRGLKSPFAREVFGGDPDDPRWPEHLGRRLEFARTLREKQEANRDIEQHMRGESDWHARQFPKRKRPRTLGALVKE